MRTLNRLDTKWILLHIINIYLQQLLYWSTAHVNIIGMTSPMCREPDIMVNATSYLLLLLFPIDTPPSPHSLTRQGESILVPSHIFLIVITKCAFSSSMFCTFHKIVNFNNCLAIEINKLINNDKKSINWSIMIKNHSKTNTFLIRKYPSWWSSVSLTK